MNPIEIFYHESSKGESVSAVALHASEASTDYFLFHTTVGKKGVTYETAKMHGCAMMLACAQNFRTFEDKLQWRDTDSTCGKGIDPLELIAAEEAWDDRHKTT